MVSLTLAMKIFKFEIKRSVFNVGMLISLLIGLIITVPYAVQNYINEINTMQRVASIGVEIGADVTSLYTRWFGMSASVELELYFYIFPLLAVLPAGTIYHADCKSGYIKNLYTRCSKIKCLTAKYVSVFFSGGIAVTVPLLISFMITSLYAPARIPDSITFLPISGSGMWGELYFTMPWLYTAGYFIIDFVFGGLFAVLALSLTHFLTHRFSVFISSFVAVIVVGFICTQLNVNRFNPQFFLSPSQPSVNASFIIILSEALALLIGSACLHFFGGYKNENV